MSKKKNQRPAEDDYPNIIEEPIRVVPDGKRKTKTRTSSAKTSRTKKSARRK